MRAWLLVAVTVAALAYGMWAEQRVAASGGGVPVCELIATTGNIDILYCETNYGDFFVNSVGFMILAD